MAVLKEAEIFGASVVDSSADGFALEATGDPEKLGRIYRRDASYGEIEVTRSRLVAVRSSQEAEAAPPVRTRPCRVGLRTYH